MPASLAHLRFDAASSRGRRFPEAAHPYRDALDRDRARVIHSRSFRRLEGKTQVFSPRRGDHFRNRLTHTLEVQQIARTVSGALGLNSDLVEVLALAHDIGHPPFGHAGESELNRQMQLQGSLFDHNLHALRLVEEFEQRYPLFPGLNLIWEVREGLVKHSRDWSADPPAIVQPYEPQRLPTLEAQLIDLADEIAYNTSDIEDAFQGELITLDNLADASPLLADRIDTLVSQYPASSDWILLQEMTRQLVDYFVTGLIEGTSKLAAATGVKSAEDVRDIGHRLAAYTPEVAQTRDALKGYLRREVYESADIVSGRTESIRRMRKVFDYLMAHPEELPDGYEDSRPLHDAVCDYLAGMTDSYFTKAYASLIRN